MCRQYTARTSQPRAHVQFCRGSRSKGLCAKKQFSSLTRMRHWCLIHLILLYSLLFSLRSCLHIEISCAIHVRYHRLAIFPNKAIFTVVPQTGWIWYSSPATSSSSATWGRSTDWWSSSRLNETNRRKLRGLNMLWI